MHHWPGITHETVWSMPYWLWAQMVETIAAMRREQDRQVKEAGRG